MRVWWKNIKFRFSGTDLSAAAHSYTQMHTNYYYFETFPRTVVVTPCSLKVFPLIYTLWMMKHREKVYAQWLCVMSEYISTKRDIISYRYLYVQTRDQKRMYILLMAVSTRVHNTSVKSSCCSSYMRCLLLSK